MIDPVLVAGAPRSGTSMVAGLLARHGVSTGKMLAPTRDNARGSFESLGVKEAMKAVLVENGIAPTSSGRHLAIPRLDWLDELVSTPPWRERVLAAWDGARKGPWLVKESRILNTWPLWRQAWPDALYVLPRRPQDDVVYSMRRHPGVGQNGDDSLLRWWVLMCWARQDAIAASSRHVFVDTHSMALGDLGECRRVVEACGLRFDEDIAREWVRRDLWHAA